MPKSKNNNSHRNLNKKINVAIQNLNSFKSDLNYLKRSENVQEFFKYFQYEYGFDYDEEYYQETNFLEIFYDLDYYMGWFNFSENEENYFRMLNQENKKIYLKKFYKNFNLVYTEKYSTEENFNYLKKHYFNIYQKAKDFITDFTEGALFGRFQKLKDLKEIILKYKLRNENEIPETISGCKRIIERELFVNIHDFVRENDICFNSLRDLSDYTHERELYYPRELAKQTYAHRVLLKKLLG